MIDRWLPTDRLDTSRGARFVRSEIELDERSTPSTEGAKEQTPPPDVRKPVSTASAIQPRLRRKI